MIAALRTGAATLFYAVLTVFALALIALADLFEYIGKLLDNGAAIDERTRQLHALPGWWPIAVAAVLVSVVLLSWAATRGAP